MAYQVITIQPTGEFVRETLEQVPDTDWLKQRLNGGWLELVPEFDAYGYAPCVAFCDEDGKVKGLPMNPKATYLWYACLAPHPFRPDTLHGPIVIVTADEPDELKAL